MRRRGFPITLVLVLAFALPAGAQATPDVSTSMSCPAHAKIQNELVCAFTVKAVGDTPAVLTTARLSAPAGAELVAVAGKGPGSSDASCTYKGTQAFCTLPVIDPGKSVRVLSHTGFALPLGARVGSSSLPAKITGAAKLNPNDPTPADDSASATVRLVYPKVARFRPGGHRATAHTASTGLRTFCGVASTVGNVDTRSWCMWRISSARTGGHWGCGYVGANIGGLTKFLSPKNRDRQIEINARVQVRASTELGGAEWSTVQDLTYHDGTFWGIHNTLGTDPYLYWRWRYFGPAADAWAHDSFSLQQPGELYRVQGRVQFADRIFGHYFEEADSGWWSLRYLYSGCVFTPVVNVPGT
jgi:hypothetical protein